MNEGRYLAVSKSNYSGNLGLLTAGLKSSKKEYLAFSDPSIVHRAVIKTVLIPAVELEHLDKAVKPAYWFEIKDLESSKGFDDVTVEDFKNNKYGELYSIGLSSDDGISSVMKWHNISEADSKVVVAPNKYSIITKKF
jgi:hypothetical protein